MSLQLAPVLAAEHPNSFMFPGDVNEMWWNIAAFVIVVALLYKFGWAAIVKGFRSRTEKIELELAAAEAAKAEAAAASGRIVSAVANADEEAARIVDEAGTTAEALRVQLRARADDEVSELRRRAAADIVASKNQAIADLQSEVSALALGAAETVVRRNLDATTHSALIDDYIDKVGAG
ncbi:MAG: F0F1 ATP synthase subunit B [Acidimicrobiia bacterium]|nr:F0F1 ATP synthase subunit B [Acidimicrobiia bacterium]